MSGEPRGTYATRTRGQLGELTEGNSERDAACNHYKRAFSLTHPSVRPSLTIDVGDGDSWGSSWTVRWVGGYEHYGGRGRAEATRVTPSALIWINLSARIAVVTLGQEQTGILTAMRWLVGPDGSVALDHGALTGEAAARDEWVRACRDIKPTEPVRGPDSLGRAARNRGGR